MAPKAIEVRFGNGLTIRNAEAKIRGYCRVEVYWGYDDRCRVDDRIALEDIEAANNLFAGIRPGAALAILKSSEIPAGLAALPDEELDEIPPERWEQSQWDLARLLWAFCSLRWVDLAVATRVLHLKRPHLIPILDPSVVRFLLGSDPSTVEDKEKLVHLGLAAIEIIRQDLMANRRAFRRLESALSDLPIPLPRVRLYDILAWSTEKWNVGGDLRVPWGMVDIPCGVTRGFQGLSPSDAGGGKACVISR